MHVVNDFRLIRQITCSLLDGSGTDHLRLSMSIALQYSNSVYTITVKIKPIFLKVILFNESSLL